MEPWSATLTAVVLFLAGVALGQDDQREVPIIKQINRVNDDGTYTFGYEAADGSFKIETRDVLGNVKGMFGYIDERGELKRVSYTANNGTGFQATGNIGGRDNPTRRPILVYRGLGGRTPEVHEEESSTTASYGDYLPGRRGYITTTTEEPSTTRPVRVLVTKRPVQEPNRNPNLIRRQLDRDDYTARRIRYQQLQSQPDPREVYRNQLLEQNNLKPEYSTPLRARYYAPPVQEEEYADVPVTPVERQLPQRYVPQRIPQRYYEEPQRYTPQRYYEDPYLLPDRRYPVPGFSRRPPYDTYDYETFREAMNYLIQYLQYMRRADPYGPYPVDYPRGRLPSPGYGQRVAPPPVLPYAGYPASAPLGYPGPAGLGPAYQPPIPGLAGPYQPPAPNLPYINPNVQYSSSESSQGSSGERLSSFKSRMDVADHSDNTDTRPPSSALIRMLLARPSTQRPVVRSVEILGTAATSAPTAASSTTTEQSDLMEASS